MVFSKHTTIVILFVTVHSFALNDKTDQPLYFIASLTASARIPIGFHASYWNTYPTGGVFVTMPSTLRDIAVTMGMEGGIITDSRNTMKIQSLSLRCGILLPAIFRYKALTIEPMAGVASQMVGGASDGLIDLTHWHVFGRVENEFGIYAGIAPSVDWESFTFSLPVFIDRIFSSPDRFTTAVISLCAGYCFGK